MNLPYLINLGKEGDKVYLVIAEKPDLATDIAKAILTQSIEKKPWGYCGVGSREYAIISAFGHLMELEKPENYNPKYKQWSLEDLPMMFPDWKIVPSQEPYKKERLKEIGKLLKSCEAVVHAGDPDEEGQLLIDEILQYFSCEKPVFRVLINDNLPKNIRKEFENLKENIEFLNIGKSANARRMADMCFGINESRLACLKLQRKGLSIGRVQTPTLGLVVRRDEAIKNHKKEIYFESTVFIEIGEKKIPFQLKIAPKYLEEIGSKYIFDKSYLEEICKNLKKEQHISTIVKMENISPALPYNLTVLQSEMNKKYGYSMSKTLEITQNLRDKYKAISYNRSDCRYLKMEHYKEASEVFRTIISGEILEEYELDFSIQSKCFNDSNVSAHHAIIPLATNVPLDKFTEEEKNVYYAICLQYAMQFLPSAQNAVSISKFIVEDGSHKHECVYQIKENVNPGFLKYFKQRPKKNGVFLEAGNYTGTVFGYQVEEKETKPLKPYTEGTLCLDMANICKYVEDPEIKSILLEKDQGKKGENGSIGTVATRGEIVSKLIKKQFLKLDGKKLVSTELGREFYHLLPKEISSADITAKWWLMQEQIKKGQEKDPNVIQKSVIEEFVNHRDSAYNTDALQDKTIQRETVGKCPVCGNDVEKIRGKFGSYFKCKNCDYHAAGQVAKREIANIEILRLLAGETIFMSGFKKKSGGNFSAEIKLETEDGKGIYKMRFKN